ncbi:MAG: GntR family transcriptional regulator [Betaproteobacteria bacterium]|nr:GntR family transcriptional regulator [Betaproteobacteria bacterium]
MNKINCLLFWYKPLPTSPNPHGQQHPQHRQRRRRQRRTLASQAHDLLRRDILSGTLAPGQRLRTKDLQARYGLGLSPLRESLQRLSAEGIVVNDAQRGFAVAPVSVAELRDLTVAAPRWSPPCCPWPCNWAAPTGRATSWRPFTACRVPPCRTTRRPWRTPACGSCATAAFTTRWWLAAARPGCCACTASW